MSLTARQVLIAPVVSEKSYSLIEAKKYAFRVHPDAHKTQIRQAVEELFDVRVIGVNVSEGAAEAEASRPAQGDEAGLEEGDRPGARGRRDPDLRRSPGLKMTKMLRISGIGDLRGVVVQWH